MVILPAQTEEYMSPQSFAKASLARLTEKRAKEICSNMSP
jgi:hypothetical protein